MNGKSHPPLRNALSISALAALVAMLAACDRGPSAEQIGQDIDRSIEKAGQQVSEASDQAAEKIDQAKSAIADKAAKAGTAISDTAITAKVKSALLAEPGLQATGIDVVTENGVVSLYGTAISNSHKERATLVSAAIEGVRSVENNLAIVQGS
ncbi:MAG: BON domain-containing protein [Burkholderiales bacterium]|nr:BON domain-containing protein [Burkholderiales bacterium]